MNQHVVRRGHGDDQRDLRKKAAKAQRQIRAENSAAQLKIVRFQAQCLCVEQVPYAHCRRDDLPGHRCGSRAHHAPVQNEDCNRVQNAVCNRACQHGEHGELRAAVRADDGIDCLSEDVDGNADGDVGEIFLCIGQICLRRTEQRQKRHLEHGIEHRDCDAYQYAQRHGAADGAVRVLRLVFAEADRHIAARAVADHDGETEG